MYFIYIYVMHICVISMAWHIFLSVKNINRTIRVNWCTRIRDWKMHMLIYTHADLWLKKTYVSAEHCGVGEILFWAVNSNYGRWGQDVAEGSQQDEPRNADAYRPRRRRPLCARVVIQRLPNTAPVVHVCCKFRLTFNYKYQPNMEAYCTSWSNKSE